MVYAHVTDTSSYGVVFPCEPLQMRQAPLGRAYYSLLIPKMGFNFGGSAVICSPRSYRHRAGKRVLSRRAVIDTARVGNGFAAFQ